MRLTIATKLSLISATFIAVTAASIITAFYVGGSRSLLTNSLKQYSTMAQQEGQRLNIVLADSVNDLQFIAQLQSLSAYAEQLGQGRFRNTDAMDDLAQMVEHEFHNLLLHDREYRQLRFIDSAGMERIRVDRLGQSISNIDGEALQDKSASDYVIETLKLPGDAVYFSDINLNKEHGKIVEPHIPTLRIATPVTDSTRRTVGMLILNIDIGSQLHNVRFALGELSQYAYITNARGSYLSHYDSSKTFGFETPHDHRIQELLPELSNFYQQPHLQQFVILPHDNHAALASAFRKIHYDMSNPEHFIVIGIAAPEDVVLADELSLIRRNIFWAILLTATGIFAALIFSLRLTRPLNTISNAAQRFISKREIFTGLPDGDDEIAHLGHVIKDLTDEVLDNENRLKTLNATLEQRIEERSRALVASQKMLETVLDALPNRIFWKDTDGKYIGCNQHFVNDAGLTSPQEIIGKNDYDMPWAEHAAAYQHDDRLVIDSGTSKLNIIEPFTLSDGTSRWLETHKLPLRNAEGEIIGILASYQDITERRTAERKLQLSEDRLRKSQQIAHVGTWDWNIADDTLHWSDEIYSIFGFDTQQFEASYESFLKSIHPDDVERVSAAVEYSIDHSEAPYYIGHRIIRSDGEIRYVEEHGEVYRDSEGLPVRMIGVVHDITDNTLAQLELHREKERTERYLQVSEAMIVELNTEGRVVRINQRGCDLLGYQMADLLDCNWFDLVIASNTRTQVKEVFVQLMQQPVDSANAEGSNYFENQLLCHNGEIITVAWHNTVNYDEHGHTCGTLSSGQDITQRKQTEKLKDEFISTVSHELRTPLTSIHGSLRLILGHVFGEIPEKVLELLQVANNNSERLLTLINDLLDIQKIEAGMMQFNFTPTSPILLLQEAVDNNHPYALQHKIEISLHISENNLPEQIEVDHARLIQVMNNLISNAIKFSPSGEKVEVILRGDDGHIYIEVNDHGTGIPEHHREQLFDKFTQVDSSDTRQKGGTGLGLNIASMIVGMHRGTITYHDNSGGGSSFRVTLPLHATSSSNGDND